MCYKTLNNDFLHYPKPFFENLFGTPDCPEVRIVIPDREGETITVDYNTAFRKFFKKKFSERRTIRGLFFG